MKKLNQTEAKLIDTKNRMVVARGEEGWVGKMGKGDQEVKTYAYKMKKFIK